MPSVNELELHVAWQRFVAAERAWFDAVLERHREPHRRYHSVRHLRWVVRHAVALTDAYATRIGDAGAVVAAAFFHDVVYDPTAHTNEAASAGLAERALGELGWPVPRASRVATLVRATAEHAARAGPDDELDTAVLLAADLAVLAADPASYQEYVIGVRAEYSHVDDAAWRAGRTRVLRSFVDRVAIYDPVLGLTDWERRARANLAAELATLTGVSGG